MPRTRVYPPGPPPPPPPQEGGLLALIQPDPLVWLYAIDLPSTPRSKYRLAANKESVHFERDSTGSAIEYSPSEVFHEDVRQDVEGAINKVKLTVQNITRESVALLKAYHWLIGEKVRVVCVRLADTPDGAPVKEEVYDVLDASARETVAVLTLGRAALAQKKFPDRRVSRTYCAHRYGGPACGYDTTRGGALQVCSKLRDGPDGCIEHGLNEAAASLPNRHPQRMLVFPGVPRA